MKEFKGTKGKWEVIENSWSDTTLVCGEKEIATKSIYYEATEETQEELENEVTANFNLIASAPELLEALQECLNAMEHGDPHEPTTSIAWGKIIFKARKAINLSLGE